MSGAALRMSQTADPVSQLGVVCHVVVGCGLLFCLSFQVSGEGIDAPGVSFYYPVGCDVGCVVFEVFGSLTPPIVLHGCAFYCSLV